MAVVEVEKMKIARGSLYETMNEAVRPIEPAASAAIKPAPQPRLNL